jgi:hypothetical protein
MRILLPVALLCAVFSVGRFPVSAGAVQTTPDQWTRDFRVAAADWTASGQNPYFILEPGYQLVLEDARDTLQITVLNLTSMIDGVQTRVVEERETRNDIPIEVSRNFFAMSRRTNSVYYFGEEVDIYKDGKIVDHEGAWRSGVNEARFGLMMPGEPLLHARFYQELAPKVAMDRAEIVSLSARVTTPLGTFGECLQVLETTPLEPGVKESKYYARGIGLVQDGSLKLVRHGARK